MNKIINLTINDFRNIFRDTILTILFFVPVIFIIILRFLLPELLILLPVLNDYVLLFLAVLCSITASFPAYIISFIMLDEKDEDILTVFKVMPISPLTFIFYRLAFITLFAFIFNVVIIYFSGISVFNWWQILLLSLSFATLAPVIALIIITYARNKIEGVTYFKGLNFILMFAIIGYFIQSAWKYVFGIIPVFWTYQSFLVHDSSALFIIFTTIATVLQLFLLMLLYRQFRKRIF